MVSIGRSWGLVKASWGVLRQDKELTLLPLLSFLAYLLVAFVFLAPIALLVSDTPGDESWTSNPVTWVLGFVAYVALAYVLVFFNAAIVCGADERLRGGDPTLGSALSGAASHAGALLPWAIVTATVTMVLRAIEERLGFLGTIIAGLVGLAWSLVTFLVIPVLIIERIGAVAAVKRSAQLFKSTWGENMIANGGIGIVSMLAIFAGAFVTVPLLYFGGIVAGAGVVLFVVWLGVVVCVSQALTGIFQLALYRYAVDGTVPAFGDEHLQAAFRPRGRRGEVS